MPSEVTPESVIELAREQWPLCQSIELHQPTLAWVRCFGTTRSDYRLSVLREGMEAGQHQIYTAPTLCALAEEIEKR